MGTNIWKQSSFLLNVWQFSPLVHVSGVDTYFPRRFKQAAKDPLLTDLRRVDGDHRAEGALSFAVVSADLDVERRERRDAVVAVHVARRTGGGGGHVGPADLSEGAEGDDVTEAFAVLQFFGDRLRVKHKTIVILKHIQTAHMSPAAGLPRPAAIIGGAERSVWPVNCFCDPANKRSS